MTTPSLLSLLMRDRPFDRFVAPQRVRSVTSSGSRSALSSRRGALACISLPLARATGLLVLAREERVCPGQFRVAAGAAALDLSRTC